MLHLVLSSNRMFWDLKEIERKKYNIAHTYIHLSAYFFLNTSCICCMLHLVCYVYQSAQLRHFFSFMQFWCQTCDFRLMGKQIQLGLIDYNLQKLILRKRPLIAPQLCSSVMRPSAWLRKLNYFHRAIMIMQTCHLSYKSSSQIELYGIELSNLSMTIAYQSRTSIEINSVSVF